MISIGVYSRVPRRAAALKGLSRTALRVLIAVCRYVDGAGRAWPSLKTLAEDAALDRRNVPAALGELERFGLLSRERRDDEAGDKASTVYVVRYEVSSNDMTPGVIPPNDTVSSQQMTPDIFSNVTVSSPEMTPGVMSRDALSNPLSEETHRRRARAKARLSFPVDWAPSHAGVVFAKSRGYSDTWIADQAIACREFHIAKGNIFADLDAAWRTWVLRAPAFDRKPVAAAGGSSPVASEPWPQRIAAFRSNGFWPPLGGPKPGEFGCGVPDQYLTPVEIVAKKHADSGGKAEVA